MVSLTEKLSSRIDGTFAFIVHRWRLAVENIENKKIISNFPEYIVQLKYSSWNFKSQNVSCTTEHTISDEKLEKSRRWAENLLPTDKPRRKEI